MFKGNGQGLLHQLMLSDRGNEDGPAVEASEGLTQACVPVWGHRHQSCTSTAAPQGRCELPIQAQGSAARGRLCTAAPPGARDREVIGRPGPLALRLTSWAFWALLPDTDRSHPTDFCPPAPTREDGRSDWTEGGGGRDHASLRPAPFRRCGQVSPLVG